MSKDRTSSLTVKAAKSCTECRRRKIKCIRASEDAQICRRCEERGTQCIPQTLQPSQRRGFSSRQRISQLESEVADLRKVVHNIQRKLGQQPLPTPEATLPQDNSSRSSPDTDGDSDTSVALEVPATAPPAHLYSLFQNDLLFVDACRECETYKERQTVTTKHLLELARHALQKLIPPREEVVYVVQFAPRGWFELPHTLLPQPFTSNSSEELLTIYDEIAKPDANAISIASWLLTIALTAQQVPGEQDNHGAILKTYLRNSAFAQAVLETVETTILSHDKLIGTLDGLAMAIPFFRLQISQGHFKKWWLQLRHFVSVAELMGLPKVFQAVHFGNDKNIAGNESLIRKARLWETLSSAEGLCGMIVNLPPSSGRYPRPSAQPLVVDGVVQPREYLTRLIDIATKVQYRDDVHLTQGSGTELYGSVLELDRELRVLASQTPKSWWMENSELITVDHILQFLHHCTMMRLHLTLAVGSDLGEEFTYSRMACMDACQSMARRYQFLRPLLPSGIFLRQLLDLQAFTGTVILLLTSHRLDSRSHTRFQVNKAEVDKVAEGVLKLMEEKSKDVAGSKIAHHAVNTIRSLMKLLEQNGEGPMMQETTLNIPLLGKVYLRRSAPPVLVAEVTDPDYLQPTVGSHLWRSNGESICQGVKAVRVDAEMNMGHAPQVEDEWQWDSFSWDIEDQYNDFFSNTFVQGGLDQLPIRQDGYNSQQP